MASLYDDFGDKTVDATISGQGYTQRATSTGDALVRSDISGDYESDKYVELATSSKIWTPDDATDSTARQQVYLKGYPTGVSSWRMVAFARVNADATSHYGCGLLSDGDVRLFKEVSGTFTTLTTFSLSYTATDQVHVLFEVDVSGSDQVVRAKAWLNAAAEPGTWNSATDSTSPLTSGWPGFGQRQASGDVAHLDAFGWGEGEDAPTEDTAQLATPSNFAFTAAAGLRQLDGSWDAVTDADTYDYEVEEDDGGAWVAFDSGNTASTSFQLTDADGVAFGTTYRGRVRAVPAP